jgi:hypothetical protein
MLTIRGTPSHIGPLRDVRALQTINTTRDSSLLRREMFLILHILAASCSVYGIINVAYPSQMKDNQFIYLMYFGIISSLPAGGSL